MNKTWSKPYEVRLKDRSSFTEKVEFEDGECLYKELFTPEVERYSFATEEEAYEHAKQYGLKDDEYDVIKWMYRNMKERLKEELEKLYEKYGYMGYRPVFGKAPEEGEPWKVGHNENYSYAVYTENERTLIEVYKREPFEVVETIWLDNVIQGE